VDAAGAAVILRRLAALFLASPLAAHIGSPDVFFEGKAGPYPLFVAIRTPAAIPGIAEVEVRAGSSSVERIRITALPMTGEAARHPPAPEPMRRSTEDPQFFTGSLWLMTSGSWQVRLQVSGPEGDGQVSVPVPAAARRTLQMEGGLAAILFALMIFLAAGLVSIAGAAAREAKLSPGLTPDYTAVRKGRVAMVTAFAIVLLVLGFGRAWWEAEASGYSRIVYKPLDVWVTFPEPSLLRLEARDPGWLSFRSLDDLLPDHGHLMHMYLIREPHMDFIWHLHPEMSGPGSFKQRLPDMPRGRYRVFGDIVHGDGFPETLTASFELAEEIKGHPLEGDDSGSRVAPVGHSGAVSPLSRGHRMVMEPSSECCRARQPYSFRFRIEDEEGKAARGMELYMGMLGHAAFVKHDFSVFAHVHPTGSVPMSALSLTEEADDDGHAGHGAPVELPSVVSFPYGFPAPGSYRIIVQVKRAGAVETAAFDVEVI
jgi:hypothetical protein